MRFAEIFKIELFSKYGQKAGCYINEIYDVIYENGEIKSTKTSSLDEHGVGIKNVLKSIEKYGGSYVIEDKNKEFFFSIIIPA